MVFFHKNDAVFILAIIIHCSLYTLAKKLVKETCERKHASVEFPLALSLPEVINAVCIFLTISIQFKADR